MNIGDYVRTDKGLIGKIIKKEEYDTHTILEYEGQYCKRVLSTTGTDSEVIKSSPNIIDLIEVGDYVNGYKVLEIEKDYLLDYREEINVLIVQNGEVYEVAKKIYNDDIKSIVTKEQFESMEYKVKE